MGAGLSSAHGAPPLAGIADGATARGAVGDPLLPGFDERARLLLPIDETLARHAYEPVGRAALECGDARPPRRIWQIWLGARPRRRSLSYWADGVRRWRAFARAHGFRYRMVGMRSAEVRGLRARWPRQVALAEEREARGDYCGASDVLRLLLLHDYGGLYVDADIGPPRVGDDGDARAVVEHLFFAHALTALDEAHGRDVAQGASAFHANGCMAAARHHPALRLAVDALLESVAHFRRAVGDPAAFDTLLCVGAFFLNRMWRSTPVHVVPLPLAGHLRMFQRPEDAD